MLGLQFLCCRCCSWSLAASWLGIKSRCSQQQQWQYWNGCRWDCAGSLGLEVRSSSQGGLPRTAAPGGFKDEMRYRRARSRRQRELPKAGVNFLDRVFTGRGAWTEAESCTHERSDHVRSVSVNRHSVWIYQQCRFAAVSRSFWQSSFSKDEL